MVSVNAATAKADAAWELGSWLGGPAVQGLIGRTKLLTPALTEASADEKAYAAPPPAHDRGCPATVARASEEVDFDGRRGLRAPADRRVRGAGRDAAGVGTAVIGSMITDVTGGVIALALLVYLVVALVSPERF